MANESAGIALAAGVLVTGKTGSGKTSTTKRLIEDLCWHQHDGTMPRVCVLDPIKSDWWGITLASDGKGHGLPFVVLGGPHGHVPLSESSGTAIGELVASGKLPMSVIDMAFFKMGGLQRFYCDFAEALFRNNKSPLHLVLEEAHEFAPKERSGASGENMAVYWSKKLATGARTKGVRLILATQRTQSLHNALMGSCETLLAHRMTLPADVAPVTDWLKANLDKPAVQMVQAEMPRLANGQAYVCREGVAVRHQFMLMRTFDNTKTPDGTEVDAAPPPVDRDTLLSLVGTAVKEAEENDPVALKKRIKELEARPGHGNHVVFGQREVDASYERGRKDGYDNGHFDGKRAGFQHALDCMRSSIDNFHLPTVAPSNGKTELSPSPMPAGSDLPARRVDDTRADPGPALSKQRAPAKGGGGGNEAAGMQLLEAIARQTLPDWTAVSLVAGVSQVAAYFHSGKRWLENSGLIAVNQDGITLTARGRKAAANFEDLDDPVSLTELLAVWKPKLGGAGGKIMGYMSTGGRGTYDAKTVAKQVSVSHVAAFWHSGVSSLRRQGILAPGSRDAFKFTPFVEALR